MDQVLVEQRDEYVRCLPLLEALAPHLKLQPTLHRGTPPALIRHGSQQMCPGRAGFWHASFTVYGLPVTVS